MKDEHSPQSPQPERETAPSNIEILIEENDEVRGIKENGLNLNYFDQSNNIFFCEASCVTPLDEQNKFTEGLFDCVSFIILAKRNGMPVSFISHFNPKTIRDENERLSVNEKADYFEKWLQDYLSGISQSLDPGSVNSYLAGGKEEKRYLKYGEDSPLAVLSGKDDYAYLKRILTSVSYEAYGSSPQIALNPAIVFGGGHEKDDTRVYVDTQKQKIYIVRPATVS